MLSANKALLGNRVYGGATTAPNRGQVSARGAQGYIQRELRNKRGLMGRRRLGFAAGQPKGNDGKSDSRSTVAAQAAKRRTQLGGRPIVKGVKGGKQGGGLAGNNEPKPVPQVPTVRVNDEGFLELPYNQQYSEELYGYLNEANQGLLGLKTESDQQQLDYTQSKRDMQVGYDQLRRNTLNQNAAAGTAFSSRYGTAVGTNATNFANQMSGLEQQNALFQQNQSLQRQAIQQALNQQIALATQRMADQLGDEAGSLGYGKSKAPVKNGSKGSNHRKGNKKGHKGKSRGAGKNKKSGGSNDRKRRGARAYIRKQGGKK